MADPNAQPPASSDPATEFEDGVTPQFASAAEREAFNANVFSQLQAQQAEAAAAMAANANQPLAPAGDVSNHIHADSQKNKHVIVCKFCETKVLLPEASVYQQQQRSLHKLGGAKEDTATETMTDWWVVSSQMHFENVGVTRTVDPSFRYLTCGNCDKGPIGINFLNEPSKFFVAHERIKYKQ